MAREDLGGGFTLGKGPPESSGKHLYFKGNDLGQVGYVSVSPSGEYAIFERDRDIFLIKSSSGNLNPVTDGEFSAPKQVRWSEDQGYAVVEYSTDRPNSRIPLR